MNLRCLISGMMLLFFFGTLSAQTTSFTYQGSLNSGGTTADGNHDFEFALFDSLASGAQLGTTIVRSGVAVSNGVFSVSLDFGSQFPGAVRFLEIRVRPSGGGAFTTLTPRQQLDSAPYAIKTLSADTAVNATNATQLGGVPANQYVLTGDPRLSDERPPTAGSSSYIQNQNTTPQVSTNFNISGNGIIGGRVGVGIPTPASKLDVYGTNIGQCGPAVIGWGQPVTPRPCTQALAVTTDDPTIRLINGMSNSLTVFSVSGTGRVFTNENVGIGTSSPSERLHVTGNGLFTGNLTVNGAINGNLPAGSSSYIQNQTAAPQASSNFSISGNGTVGGTVSGNIVNATTQYNLGGSRVLSVTGASPASPSSSTFVGIGAGANAAGSSSNSFFGSGAGQNTTDVGLTNAFFGKDAGFSNQSGDGNSFLGNSAGSANTTGNQNAFFGNGAGNANVSGIFNTVIGASADVGSSALARSTAIGSRALVTQSDSIVLGAIDGVNGSTISTRVGIGTTAPARTLHVASGSAGSVSPNGNSLFVLEQDGNAFIQMFSPDADETGVLFGRPSLNIKGGVVATPTDGLQFRSGGNTTRMTLDAAGNFGIGTGSPNDRLDVNGSIRVTTLGAAGATALCRNASNQIATCSSSGRYKSNIDRFTGGLDLLRHLRPVSFNWLGGGMPDLGFVAEEVAMVEPLLTTTNEKGQVEGVKYDRVGVVLVNAVKEQQAQIESQSEIIKRQQQQIDALTKLVCATNGTAEVCKENR